MTTPNRFGILPDDASAPGSSVATAALTPQPVTEPSTAPSRPRRASAGYSSAEDAAARLRARRAQERWWEGSETSFGIVARILLSLPVLALALGLLYVGFTYSRGALVLLVLAFSGAAWFLKDLWLRR